MSVRLETAVGLGSMLVALCVPAVPAVAQAPLAAAESAADRGETSEARAIVERWFADRAASASREQQTHAHFLRGRLMSDADSAEVEYLKAAIDGVGPLAGRARLRLAQLELTRGDYARAEQHLDQLRVDDPGGSLVPTSWVWSARVAEARGDAGAACEAWSLARSALPSGDPAWEETTQSRSRCEESERQPGELETYTVQLGAFGTEEAAIRLRDGAAGIGVAVRVEGPGGGVRVHRVRAGRFGTREAAEMLAERFRQAGFDAIVVPEVP